MNSIKIRGIVKKNLFDAGAVCIGTTTLGADPSLNNESLENNNGKVTQLHVPLSIYECMLKKS